MKVHINNYIKPSCNCFYQYLQHKENPQCCHTVRSFASYGYHKNTYYGAKRAALSDLSSKSVWRYVFKMHNNLYERLSS